VLPVPLSVTSSASPCGDCTQVLPTFPSESVDLVVTDPPYGVRYRDRAGRSVANDGNLGNSLGAFTELYRILKPNTFCISFYGWNSVAAFLNAWNHAGFSAVGHIVWHEGYASRRGFLNARHEQAYVLVKGHPPSLLIPSTTFDAGNIVVTSRTRRRKRSAFSSR
jgi:site-specific DNA-methyltransferase (adenine-specific)